MTPHSLFAPARRVGQGLLRTQADDRLVDLARSGSEPAFEAIVARYRKPLLRYCVRLVSEQRAEEAMQETFVRAYGALMRGEEVRTLKPWLYRIAHNSALNTVRARPLPSGPLDEQVEALERTDLAAERQEGFREVVDAVQALPLRQRDAIVQRELEGRSYDEIAAALGVSHGAVRQLLNRARTSLRAGAAAVAAPFLPLARVLAGAGEAPAGRVAELCGAGGGGVAAKLCTTVALSGVLAGGVAPATDPAGGFRERPKAERPKADRPAAKAPVSTARAAATQPPVRRPAAPVAVPAAPSAEPSAGGAKRATSATGRRAPEEPVGPRMEAHKEGGERRPPPDDPRRAPPEGSYTDLTEGREGAGSAPHRKDPWTQHQRN